MLCSAEYHKWSFHTSIIIYIGVDKYIVTHEVLQVYIEGVDLNLLKWHYIYCPVLVR